MKRPPREASPQASGTAAAPSPRTSTDATTGRVAAGPAANDSNTTTASSAPPGNGGRPAPRPPLAPQQAHEVVAPHGTRVDPWYWLRDDERTHPEVVAYLEAENAYRYAMLEHLQPFEQRLYDEIVGRIKQDDSTVPARHNGYWYYTRYEPGHEYPVYARRKGLLDAPEEVLVDANQRAAGHDFYQLASLEVSPDSRLIAFTEDRVGRREYVLRFIDTATGLELPDTVVNVEPDLAWADDNRTILYVEKDPQTLLGCRVRKHVLGTVAADDALVYEEEDDAFYLGVERSKSERHLYVISQSTVSAEYRWADAADPALRFQVALPRERDHEYQLEHLDDRFVIRTNWQATNFRIVEVPVAEVADRSRWRDVIAHADQAFVSGFEVFTRFLVVSERSGGLRKLRVRAWDGSRDFMIDADEPACTMAFAANEEADTDLLRYVYTSMTTPGTTFDYDMRTGTRTLLKREPVLGDFDPARYRTDLVWAPARDGALVPVSLLHHRDTPRDGTAPLYQYGYGAYGASQDPTFRSSVLSLVDRGFVYAIAHVRGGQELGRRWYDDGRLMHKRHSFEDFIDVTRHLVRERYADPLRVCATGGSAGGLLVGAVANLAPDEYRALVAHVPFVDIVTTMLDETIPLTTNEYDEWGNPAESAEAYRCMLSYAPYDNVEARAYPAMLVTTGLWDSQVQYWEPAKWVAKLRTLKTDDNLLLLRTNMEAGHGGQSGRFERYREIAEEYAFVLDQAGLAR
jgi:oligopeptidase B